MPAKFDRLASQYGPVFFNRSTGGDKPRRSGETFTVGEALLSGGKFRRAAAPRDRRWEHKITGRRPELFLARSLQWPDDGKPE